MRRKVTQLCWNWLSALEQSRQMWKQMLQSGPKDRQTGQFLMTAVIQGSGVNNEEGSCGSWRRTTRTLMFVMTSLFFNVSSVVSKPMVSTARFFSVRSLRHIASISHKMCFFVFFKKHRHSPSLNSHRDAFVLSIFDFFRFITRYIILGRKQPTP